jgi:hypothetical protein
MPKLSDVKIGGKFFGLFVGPPGSGKDIAANSWPGPIYNFDLDRRIDSVASMFGSRSDIEYDQFGPDDYGRFWDKILQIKSGNAPAKTYILSSITALARMAINYSISIRGNKGNSKGIVQMTDISDYNAESRIISIVLDAFRGSNFKSNLIVTAHLVETNSRSLDGSEGMQQRVLTGAKTIGAEIPAYFNEIYMFRKQSGMDGKSRFLMSTQGQAAGINTKTILPLPGEIDFTMKAGEPGLFQKIQTICKAANIEIGG